MDEIKFDSAFLNEYFKKKLGKEKVTFDDIEMLDGEIQIDGNNSTISQHDVDLIINIADKSRKDVIFRDVNFENLTMGNEDDIYRLKFYNCNLKRYICLRMRKKEILEKGILLLKLHMLKNMVNYLFYKKWQYFYKRKKY